MPTIAKFYLLDAATPNTGTMPSGAFINDGTAASDATGDATGARTARDATDVAGASQQGPVITALANTNQQRWGHRRFVSRPLAATTFSSADAAWTFSCAVAESNTNHQQIIRVICYCWRPSTGAQVGTGTVSISQPNPASGTTQVAVNNSGFWAGADVTISGGDILVFDVGTVFTQLMSTAYTDSFFYNGTTEASTTSCASFVTPPTALTLFTSAAPGLPFQFDPVPFVAPGRI